MRKLTLVIATLLYGLLSPCGMGAVQTVRVRVSMRSAADGSPLRGYVGLIGPDRPLWRPTSEGVANNGEATLQVAPGAYRVVVAARGYESETRTVRLQTSGEVSFSLPRLRRIAGTVSDVDGNAVSNAIVAQLRAVTPVPLSDSSSLARQLLGDDWQTSAHRDGRWSMVASNRAATPLVFHAPGFAPVLHIPSASNAAGADVILRKGGALRIEFDRADPDLLVSLKPHKTDVPDVPEPWPTVLFARAVTSARVEWPSLHSGTYEVIAWYPDPRRFGRRSQIGQVTIAENTTAETRLKLPPALVPARVTTALLVRQRATADLRGATAYLRTSRGEVVQTDHAMEATIGGVVVHIRGAAHPPELAYLMSPDLVVLPDTGSNDDQSTATATPHLKGDVRLRVTAEGEQLLPANAVAQFRDCISGGTLALPIALAADGRASFPYPVDCISLSIRLEPFEPLLASARLRQGETKDLGTFHLRTAGAATVYVVQQPSETPVARAVVRASVIPQGDGSRPSAVAEVVADDNGVAVLSGLPVAVDVTIDAFDASKEYSGATSVRLAAGEHRVIQPLVIPEPARLSVRPRLDPGFRERFPSARIREIMLRSADQRQERHIAKVADETVVFARVRPTEWQIVGIVEVAGSPQPVNAERIVLAAGEDREVEAILQPLVFSGQVRAGEAGVAGVLSVAEAPNGDEAIVRNVQTNAHGAFEIVLPRADIYRVQVNRIDNPRETIEIGEVSFADTGHPILIEIPSATLIVRVTAGSSPVADADVRLTQQRPGASTPIYETSRQKRTDSAGNARFDALTDGAWVVSARDTRTGRAGEKPTTLLAGEAATLNLELRAATRLAGHVRYATGLAVARARVACIFAGAGGLTRRVMTDTLADGTFTLDLLGAEPLRASCNVMTPAGEVAAFVTPIVQEAAFQLPAATATLRISNWAAVPDRENLWLVTADGRAIHLSAAATFIGAGSQFIVPRLQPGAWRLVLIKLPTDIAALSDGRAGILPSIADVPASAGESTTIEIATSLARTNGRDDAPK